MFRLEKTRDSHVLRVSGRIDAENVPELKMQMEIYSSPVALELSEVTQVDADAVLFLSMAEAAGIELRNCPLFIREWIRSEHPKLTKVGGNESARVHGSGGNDAVRAQSTEKEK